MNYKNQQFVLIGAALLLLGGILLFQVFNVPSVQIESQAVPTISAKQEPMTQAPIVNLNTATIVQLMSIDGIGVAKANAIVFYREENGEFATVEEIMEVSGIGEAIYEKVKPFLSVKS